MGSRKVRLKPELRSLARRPAVPHDQGIGRRPAAAPLTDEHPSDATSPLESAIEAESYERYRRALDELKPRDREMVVARVEVQWSLTEIAQRFGLPSVDAARMAVSRALKRLSAQMRPES